MRRQQTWQQSQLSSQQRQHVYTPVVEPKKEDLGSYYELSVDEAVSTYIAMHLSLTDEGLYVMNDNTKWKIPYNK